MLHKNWLLQQGSRIVCHQQHSHKPSKTRTYFPLVSSNSSNPLELLLTTNYCIVILITLQTEPFFRNKLCILIIHTLSVTVQWTTYYWNISWSIILEKCRNNIKTNNQHTQIYRVIHKTIFKYSPRLKFWLSQLIQLPSP